MLDTVTPPSTQAPRRWTDDDDAHALMHGLVGVSDEEIGRQLGRSAKAVHHRCMRLQALGRAPATAAAPVGSALDRAAADVAAAEAALDRAREEYAAAMAPLVRPLADALRRAGLVARSDDAQDEGGAAWTVVEALRRAGVELRVPA